MARYAPLLTVSSTFNLSRKRNRSMNLTERFLACFRIPEPLPAGISDSAYRKVIAESLNRDNLNSLLKSLEKRKDLSEAQQNDLIQDEIETIYKPKLKDLLFAEFKNGNKVLRQKRANEPNGISVYPNYPDDTERQDIREKNSNKELYKIEKIFWENIASDDFIQRQVQSQIFNLIYQLSNLIKQFFNVRLPVIFAKLDSEFPFEDQLVVAGRKKGFSYKEIIAP